MGGKPSKGTPKDRRLAKNAKTPKRGKRGIFGKKTKG